jgi:cytochrome c2
MTSDSRFVPLVLKTDTEPLMNRNLIASACKFTSLVFVFAFISFASHAQEIPTEPTAIKAGETLFNANCKACHAVKRKLVGPALAGVESRAP